MCAFAGFGTQYNNCHNYRQGCYRLLHSCFALEGKDKICSVSHTVPHTTYQYCDREEMEAEVTISDLDVLTGTLKCSFFLVLCKIAVKLI